MDLLHLQQDPKVATCNCSISSFKQDVYPTSYFLTFVLGLTGNIMSLFYFVVSYRKKKIFSSVKLYMVNLLLSDFMLVCSLPLRASYYLMDTWIFGDVACRVISYVFYINMYSSIYFFMVLSTMRCLAVTCPYRYVQLQSSRSSWVVCSVVWIFVSLAAVPLLKEGIIQGDDDKVRCLELNTRNISIMVNLNYATLVIGFVLPGVVITVCYIVMVCRLMKPKKELGIKSPSYKKSCALVIIIMIIFLVCFLPYHVVRTVFLHVEKEVSTNGCSNSCQYVTRVRKAAVITLCLAAGNSCLDSVLFIFMGGNICNFYQKEAKRRSIWNNRCELVDSPNADLQELNIKSHH
ncbi:cysteinyl leukotriene receptor 2 [Brienomyrus brachyistius]|uniref:cysteinyl leukotriene receptor 2 n=1 Tax=Brienomyrus brachyistius TaxID=42636 RepID=UPI0020B3FB44|nr:cysteinyl leukotriene receptor 2 [Brienomyrus brachyistius]